MSLSVADFTIDNASGQAVRLDIQACFKALQGQSAETTDIGQGAAASTQCVAGMTFLNTGTNAGAGPTLKIRNSANSAFTVIGPIDEPHLGLLPVAGGTLTGVLSASAGSVSVPSLNFSDNTTGFYRSGTNEIGISNNGTNTSLFKTTGTEIKGKLEVIPTSGGATFDIKTNGVNNQDTSINLVADTTYSTFGCSLKRLQTANGESQLLHRGTGRLHIYCQDAGEIAFTTQSVVRWEVNSGGGLYWQEHTGGGNAPISGDILPRSIISRRGVAANANVANPYNFYWDTTHLECWVDGSFTGDVSGPTSDYRIKRNVALQTESGIDKIKKLKPITYQPKEYGVLKESDEIKEGFLAHEVQEVIPSAVNREKDVENLLQTLNLDAIISVLTKALQEAVVKIETLETKVAALEGS